MTKDKRTFLVDGYQPKPKLVARGYQAQGAGKTNGNSHPPKLPKTESAVKKPKAS
ncbi:hypothetical protein SAMN04490248_11785 [Salinihabitans flavidus]|uniref:Uncharacterized protein n=1 Tax=Salinihabitans flavidus TaxID=569882 RepID=A0A1H8U009_9RHOB|nr:hypothetical protein [Salinihabitans flavidus]SEO96590.1 hypothetical protein SAMN04490248_11785 [Salinihabitans flavidus]